MTTQIEKGIPVPKHKINKGPVYPLQEMSVGDSFLITCDEKDIRKKMQSVYGSITFFKKQHSETGFTVRKVKEGEVFGVRVWRTK